MRSCEFCVVLLWSFSRGVLTPTQRLRHQEPFPSVCNFLHATPPKLSSKTVRSHCHCNRLPDERSCVISLDTLSKAASSDEATVVIREAAAENPLLHLGKMCTRKLGVQESGPYLQKAYLKKPSTSRFPITSTTRQPDAGSGNLRAVG